MIHALHFIGQIAAEVVHQHGGVAVRCEHIGEAQGHHHRGQARLHIQRAVAAARVVVVLAKAREGIAGARTVMDEEYRAAAMRYFEQRLGRLGVFLGEEQITGNLCAYHAGQIQCALEFGGGHGHIRQRQRGKRGKALGMFLADGGHGVIRLFAQGQRHIRGLRFDPAEAAEQ